MKVQCTGRVLKLEIELADGRIWPFAFNALAAAELERIHPGALDATQKARDEQDLRAGVGIFYDVLAAGIRAGLTMERRDETITMEQVYEIPLDDGLLSAVLDALTAFSGAPSPTLPPAINRAQRRGKKRRG